jgi:hypothetical protein
LLPVAVSVDEPQLSVTVTTGAEGAPGYDKFATGEFDGQPLLKVTVKLPEVRPVITYGKVTPFALPDAVPVQVTLPVPLPFTVTEPSEPPQDAGFEVESVIEGPDKGAATPDPLGEVQPPTVCVTV